MAWRPNRRLGLCSVPVPLPALCPRPTTSLHASPTKCNLQGVKTKKIMYDAAENDDFDREEIPTYEEVAKLYPRPGLYRPVVLIGPPGVGRNELKRRLMATDPDKYKTPVPCKFNPFYYTLLIYFHPSSITILFFLPFRKKFELINILDVLQIPRGSRGQAKSTGKSITSWAGKRWRRRSRPASS